LLLGGIKVTTYIIQSDILCVKIDSVGAELASIYCKRADKEHLWHGDPAWWQGRAPILFPVVGRMKDGSYSYGGKSYNMPIHGFARSAEFAVASATDSKIVLECSDNADTRKLYPFAFLLQVTFELAANSLSITYRVVNRGDDTMYFSIGSHEAYRCPHEDGESFDDYYLEFADDGDYISETVTAAGLLGGETYDVIKGGRIIPLKHDLFANDALVFKNVPSSRIFLKSRKSGTVLEVDYQDAPNLGIWTMVGAPFICIEPWYGLPDYAEHDGKIENKTDIITLEAFGEFAWTHVITIH